MSEELPKPPPGICLLTPQEFLDRRLNTPQEDKDETPMMGIMRANLPWRRPEERPRNAQDILCVLKNSNEFFSGTCYWGDQEWKYTIESELSEYKMRPENLVAWLYADELPLPDWVQK